MRTSELFKTNFKRKCPLLQNANQLIFSQKSFLLEPMYFVAHYELQLTCSLHLVLKKIRLCQNLKLPMSFLVNFLTVDAEKEWTELIWVKNFFNWKPGDQLGLKNCSMNKKGFRVLLEMAKWT